MLYCYTEKGDMGLVPATPAGFKPVSVFEVSMGSGQHWAHPAISDGRLYIRHGEALMVFDIKGK
jgi:outer membrane protein assembly factor BamB